MSDWPVYFCKAAWAWPVPLSVKLCLSLLLGLGQKGRLRGRVCFGQQNLDEGIPSIMVEKHGSKSMGNPGYVASSSQKAGRQKLAFCCLFKKCGTQPMKWYPLHTERSFSSQLNLSGHFLTHMQKCAPSTIPSPVKLTRNPNDRRIHPAFQIHEEKANYPHHRPPSQ